jgi:hypothetical protein
MKGRAWIGVAAAALALGGLPAGGQTAGNAGEGASDPLNERGTIPVGGHAAPYLIRHLPVSAFPRLPAVVQTELNRRGCLIPQTYEAHAPENVVEASLERPGSKDWAVLCSANGTVALLVFFESSGATASVLATAPETERLQAHGAAGLLGFDWGIDRATPAEVRETQAGMRHPAARLEHDALADSPIDEKTVYHYYAGNAWTVVGN